jgi:hypothetical protein
MESRKERENIGGIDVDMGTTSKYNFWKEVYESALYID